MVNKIEWGDLWKQDMNRKKLGENFDWIKPNEIQKVGNDYWYKNSRGMLYYLYTEKSEPVIEAFGWDGRFSSFNEGHPCPLEEVLQVCQRWDLSVAETFR